MIRLDLGGRVRRPERRRNTMLYFKHPKRDTWHWVRTCRHLMTLIRVHGIAWLARTERRPVGELCNECRAKAKARRA